MQDMGFDLVGLINTADCLRGQIESANLSDIRFLHKFNCLLDSIKLLNLERQNEFLLYLDPHVDSTVFYVLHETTKRICLDAEALKKRLCRAAVETAVHPDKNTQEREQITFQLSLLIISLNNLHHEISRHERLPLFVYDLFTKNERES